MDFEIFVGIGIFCLAFAVTFAVSFLAGMACGKIFFKIRDALS